MEFRGLTSVRGSKKGKEWRGNKRKKKREKEKKRVERK